MIGVWTQGFALAKQALYCLSHTFSPFCSGYFGDRVSGTSSPGWPWTSILWISASQVARITGVSQCPAIFNFLNGFHYDLFIMHTINVFQSYTPLSPPLPFDSPPNSPPLMFTSMFSLLDLASTYERKHAVFVFLSLDNFDYYDDLLIFWWALGRFHYMANVNGAAINMHVQVYLLYADLHSF
jgi:hypothetical protein